MDTIDLQQLATWLAGSGIDRLELRSPEGHVLRLRGEGAQEEGALPTSLTARPDMSPVAPATVTAAAGHEAGLAHAVTAASVGIFLDHHPLRNVPFVRVGEAVAAGHLLGLLQVGSLLLPVVAPCAGTVGALRLASGSVVGYGTVLLDIHAQPAT